MNFHQILCPLIPERILGSQDALQNAPRSVQDGSKRLLKSIFFALENRSEFCLVLGSILIDFGAQNGPKKLWVQDFFGYFLGFKNALCFCLVLGRLQDGPRGSKRRPRGPRKPSGVPQEAPRGSQERSRRLQEDLKSPQEPVQRVQNPPKRCQELPKTPTKLFSEKWKNSKHGSKRHRRRLRSPISTNPKSPCLKSQNEKRRAGGGDPPWGSQSAATRRVGAYLNQNRILRTQKSQARPRAFRT